MSFYGRTHGDPSPFPQESPRANEEAKIREDIATEKSISTWPPRPVHRARSSAFFSKHRAFNEIIAHAVGHFTGTTSTRFLKSEARCQVCLSQKQGPDRLRDERSLFCRDRFIPRRIAVGDLNTRKPTRSADIALAAKEPQIRRALLRFHQSDIRNAIQQGASREDITAGIVTSIVSNYL